MSVNKIKIKDHPGVMPIKLIRRHLISIAKHTPILELDLAMRSDGEFHDRETHAVWIGFALGVRLAERIKKAKA